MSKRHSSKNPKFTPRQTREKEVEEMLVQTSSIIAAGPKLVAVKVPVRNVLKLIEKTARNWKVVSCYLDLLRPEKASEFRARWESATKVVDSSARNRFMFAVLNDLCDRLEDSLLYLVSEVLERAGKEFPSFRFTLDDELLAKMNNLDLPSRVRVYVADKLLLDLITAQLDSAEQIARRLPPQICLLKFNLLVGGLRDGAEMDPIGTLARIQKEVRPMLEELRKKRSH